MISYGTGKTTMNDFSGIIVKKVESRADMSVFIRLPWHIYRTDACWVPPLTVERKMHFSPGNPYFRHAECCFWMAFRHGRPVGRISAQVDRLYLRRYRDDTGFWGVLEAEDDPAIFHALMNTAGAWLQEHGMKRALGPFNLSINQECGLLVKGFETPPSMMMGHAPRYYSRHIEELGYRKAMDLIAYSIRKEPRILERMRRILGRRNGDFRTRPLRKRDFQQELDTMFAIFNDAWSENWGFVPFTREEYMETGRLLRFFADPGLIRIAEVNGEPAGFIVVLPNLNEIIQDLDGRLFPLGWLKLLAGLKFHRFRTARVLLMGVLKKYQDSLTGAALSLGLIRDVMNEVMHTSITELELSWILEDNLPMRRIIEALGAEPYKIYRIYEKDLA